MRPLRGHYAQRLEYLLGESPMLGSRPATDVARLEHRRGDCPWIFQHDVWCCRLDGNRNIDTTPNPGQPACARPSGQPARGDGWSYAKCHNSFAWGKDWRIVAEQPAELASGGCTKSDLFHGYILSVVMHLLQPFLRL